MEPRLLANSNYISGIGRPAGRIVVLTHKSTKVARRRPDKYRPAFHCPEPGLRRVLRERGDIHKFIRNLLDLLSSLVQTLGTSGGQVGSRDCWASLTGGTTMSDKDEAIGRLVRLLDQCDTATVVRLADDVEDSAEIGPWGVYALPEDYPRPNRSIGAVQPAYESFQPWL